jgi:hypothetical protein
LGYHVVDETVFVPDLLFFEFGFVFAVVSKQDKRLRRKAIMGDGGGGWMVGEEW